VIEQVSL